MIHRGRRATRALLACGAGAGPAFVLAFTAAGLLRPGYRARRHPVSSLELGARGWVQTASFCGAGLLYGAGAVGLARLAAPPVSPALVALVAGCLGGCAALRPDPINGYPPGTPDASRPTVTGMAHNLAAVPLMIGLPWATGADAAAALRAGKWAQGSYSAVTAVAGALGVGLSGAGFAQVRPLAENAGWLQRVYITAGLAWLTTAFVRALRSVAHGDPSPAT